MSDYRRYNYEFRAIVPRKNKLPGKMMFHKCDKCGHFGKSEIKPWLKQRWWTCCMCLNMKRWNGQV